MFFRKNSTTDIQLSIEKAKKWIKKNTVGGGIIHSSVLKKPYPEVTGYYIPSLLKWREVDCATAYGDWLLSIQTDEGAWQDVALKTTYTFDTGQILKGLYELIPYHKKYEASFLRGCDWLLKQIDHSGKLHTPTTAGFSNIGNEYIHLYALEPLKLAAKKYDREDYWNGVKRSENYYLNCSDLTDFKIITHFHAYIVEALIDLGYKDRAVSALNVIKKHQRSDGSIPAFPNVKWVCLTAILQYAVSYYKLSMLEEGDRLLYYALLKQNESGGFYGGYGWFVTYFKKIEISWPIKYLLDAIYLKRALDKKDGNAIQKGYDDCDEEYVDSYLSSHQQEPKRQYKLSYLPELMMDALSLSEDHSVLYIGCGTGGFTKILNKTKKFVGIDCSAKMIRAAEIFHRSSSGHNHGIQTQWICGRFEYYSTNEKFDVIALGAVYGPYIPLTSVILEKAKLMLKEDGFIFCSVVNHKMTNIGRMKHILKHILLKRNLDYDNVKYIQNMLIKNKLKKMATITSEYSYCDTYILKNA